VVVCFWRMSFFSVHFYVHFASHISVG